MRISGITIPDEKRVEIGLTVLFGIGRSRAHTILDKAKVEHGVKGKELTSDQESTIRKIVEEYTLEGNLKREVSGNIKRLKDVKSYKGDRHTKRMPARGQRTKTNSRTVRGNVRRTMGSGKITSSKT